MADAAVTPPPPEGFTLDQPQDNATPAPPTGFAIDQPKTAAKPPVSFFHLPQEPDPFGAVRGTARFLAGVPTAVEDFANRVRGYPSPQPQPVQRAAQAVKQFATAPSANVGESIGRYVGGPAVVAGLAPGAAPWMRGALIGGTQPSSSLLGTAINATAGAAGEAAFSGLANRALRPTLERFNSAYYRYIAEPLGLNSPTTTGPNAVTQLRTEVGNELNRANARLGIYPSRDPQFYNNLTTARNTGLGTLRTRETRNEFRKIFKDALTDRLGASQSGDLVGQDYADTITHLNNEAEDIAKAAPRSTNPRDQYRLAEAVRGLGHFLDSNAVGPAAAKQLRTAARQSYARLGPLMEQADTATGLAKPIDILEARRNRVGSSGFFGRQSQSATGQHDTYLRAQHSALNPPPPSAGRQAAQGLGRHLAAGALTAPLAYAMHEAGLPWSWELGPGALYFGLSRPGVWSGLGNLASQAARTVPPGAAAAAATQAAGEFGP
jgi:hypothetical protein